MRRVVGVELKFAVGVRVVGVTGAEVAVGNEVLVALALVSVGIVVVIGANVVEDIGVVGKGLVPLLTEVAFMVIVAELIGAGEVEEVAITEEEALVEDNVGVSVTFTTSPAEVVDVGITAIDELVFVEVLVIGVTDVVESTVGTFVIFILDTVVALVVDIVDMSVGFVAFCTVPTVV